MFPAMLFFFAPYFVYLPSVPGYVPDALLLKEVNNSLGGYSFFNNPSVVYSVADSTPYTDTDGNYILADSTTGKGLLADTATYTTNTVEGSFYRLEGADSVSPFKSASGEISGVSKITFALTASSAAIVYLYPVDGSKNLEYKINSNAIQATLYRIDGTYIALSIDNSDHVVTESNMSHVVVTTRVVQNNVVEISKMRFY